MNRKISRKWIVWAKEKFMEKKLLLISHNCLSKTGSNGRTLGNYLYGWPSENIAQLYIHPETPDFSMCKNFFCLSDNDIIHSIIKRKPAGNQIYEAYTTGNEASVVSKSSKKNSLIFLLREMAWNSPFWVKSALIKWIEDFKPDVILFQAGDAGFLFRLTVKISKKYNIPIIMYNTEGYYFKNVSYLPESKLSNLFYPLLHSYFCRTYRQLMKRTSLTIYNCDMLMNDYKKEFEHIASVVMNTSEFADMDMANTDFEHHIVYAGNVEVGRFESIVDVAEVVHSLDSSLYVDVYTSTKDALIKEKLEKCEAINLKGYVPYNELQEILKKAEYLLSVENFNQFYCEDLKYAFSTKIADSLASGNCLIVYAPETIAVSQYLKDKNASVLITSPSDLIPTFKKVLNNDEYRQLICQNARKLALENHSLIKNRDLFQQLINEAI